MVDYNFNLRTKAKMVKVQSKARACWTNSSHQASFRPRYTSFFLFWQEPEFPIMICEFFYNFFKLWSIWLFLHFISRTHRHFDRLFREGLPTSSFRIKWQPNLRRRRHKTSSCRGFFPGTSKIQFWNSFTLHSKKYSKTLNPR